MLDLNYADPLAPVFAPDEIVGRAIRVRRRRRLTLAGTAMAGVLAVIAALGLPVWWPKSATDVAQAGNPYGTNLADPVADQHRTSDPIVVLDASHGWRSFVYYSLANEVCWGAIAIAGSSRGYLTSSCGTSDDTSHAWVQKPLPLGVGDLAGDDLWVGFVEGPASTVHLDFMGTTLTAPVIPVEVHGLVGLGAYAMWVPTHGARSYGWADMSDVVATTVGGKVVATTP
jgi:hypothetical protein